MIYLVTFVLIHMVTMLVKICDMFGVNDGDNVGDIVDEFIYFTPI